MTGLIGLMNLTLTAGGAVLVLLAKERFGLGPVGFGSLMACMAAGALLGVPMRGLADPEGDRQLDDPRGTGDRDGPVRGTGLVT